MRYMEILGGLARRVLCTLHVVRGAFRRFAMAFMDFQEVPEMLQGRVQGFGGSLVQGFFGGISENSQQVS